MRRRWLLVVIGLALPLAAHAEADHVSVAEQFGIAYLPLTVMRDQGLFEKRLAEAQLQTKISWSVFSGSSQMTDAVLSGSLDFASGAFANFILLWNKSRGMVRAVAPLPATPLYFLTIDPRVHALTDLAPGRDRIAVPTVGVSSQAFLLQYAASRLYGLADYRHFDEMTVAMAHPDAVNLLRMGRTEVNNHFSSPPFQAAELRDPAVRKVASSYDIMEGPHTSSVVWSPVKFHDANPRTFMAFLLAYRDASELIRRDPHLAAEAYLRQTGSRDAVDVIERDVADPEYDYGLVPMQLDKLTGLMFDTKRLATRPDVARDVFFPELQTLAGK